jgi:hypothetical protein
MKEQNYLDNLVGVFGHPAAENPGVSFRRRHQGTGPERCAF